MSKISLQQYWHLLSRYLKPQRGRVIWLSITLLGSIALQLLNPQILRYFIDTAMGDGTQSKLLAAAISFIIVAFATQLLTVVATYYSENVAWTATNTLRTDLTAHCLSLDLSFHKQQTPGELVERVDGDVDALSRFFSEFTIHLLGNGLLLLGILVVLFFEDWRAGFFLSLFTLSALLILIRLQTYAVPAYAADRQASAEFFGFFGEQLTGTKDIRGNGAVSYVMYRFYHHLQRWLPISHRAGFAEIALWGTSIALFVSGNAIALGVGAYLWNQQAITIGTVYLIFYYTNLLREPIERIQQELESLQQAGGSLLRITDLFQVRSQLKPGGDQPLPTGALSVVFEEVWFSYDRPLGGSEANRVLVRSGILHDNRDPCPTHPEWTLQNISFHLPPGQVLGLLGRTGSGKTTLARLLLRLYDPQSGIIRLGDREIDQAPLKNLRQRVVLVTQDVQLFQTTIRNNLTFFNPAIKDSQLIESLELLGLTPWLNALPQGLDTPLGADSGGLSAGQAQLLAFARAFLKDPSLVILDEASSRLDPTTETLIERGIDKLLQGRTGIIIAHRLTTVQRANQILILDRGRVREYGLRKTLANTPDSYFAQLLKTGLADVLP
jgi:ABC-type multidrug transport system fused ATPase/permease subunit